MAKNDEKLSLKRLAVVNEDLCRPKECMHECRKACPVNRIGKQCITIGKISQISESLCIGCSACEKKCPFKAITIVNLPNGLTKDCSHRYGENSFKLHRLPVPRPGRVVGLVGTNGIGKSTALKVLSGKLKPNLGMFEKEPEWTEILKNYRGSELQGYFTKILEAKLVASNKIQYIDKVPRLLKKRFNTNQLSVRTILEFMDARKVKEYYIEKMDLENIMDRDLDELSGGELQRLSISLACMQDAEIFIFDEPSSYLDVRQRITAAREIRNLIAMNKYVIVVEHDLAILDMMCDYGCVMYGKSGAYGVVTAPQSIKTAINIFLDGYIPTENMRFRDSELKFAISEMEIVDKKDKASQYPYPALYKTYDGFSLAVEPGNFTTSEIVVFLGENGMGKSQMIGMIAGLIDEDNGTRVTDLTVSLKPQKIVPKYKGNVRALLSNKIPSAFQDQGFYMEVIKPLGIDYVMDQPISNLSGGELQRIAIIICLGTEADIYLLDEPSAFLDSEQRISIAKIIKKHIYNKKKCAFVVEHDLIVGTYLADKVIVFEGEPGRTSRASAPMSLEEGMNIFLKSLDVTFRRDPTNYRPRVNKPESAKDREQKNSNRYFFS